MPSRTDRTTANRQRHGRAIPHFRPDAWSTSISRLENPARDGPVVRRQSGVCRGKGSPIDERSGITRCIGSAQFCGRLQARRRDDVGAPDKSVAGGAQTTATSRSNQACVTATGGGGDRARPREWRPISRFDPRPPRLPPDVLPAIRRLRAAFSLSRQAMAKASGVMAAAGSSSKQLDASRSGPARPPSTVPGCAASGLA